MPLVAKQELPPVDYAQMIQLRSFIAKLVVISTSSVA
jgi:hypothetical protein